MSNTIGFKNFRRFQNFPEIDLGDITILVGGNNAGKSTLVKAMLLMRDFLKSRIESTDNSKNKRTSQRPQFSFDTEHVNVGDFYRAFCRQSPRKEENISFTMTIDKFRFIVNIRGERKPGIIPEVSMIAVSDEDRDIAFTFDFSKNQMTAHFGSESDLFNERIYNNVSVIKDLQMQKESIAIRIHELNKKLSDCKDFEMITAIKSEIESQQLRLKLIQLDLQNKENDSVENDYTFQINGADSVNYYFYKGFDSGKLIIPELIKGFVRFAEEGMLGDKRSKSYREEEANKTFLRGKAEKIKALAEELETILNKQVIEYIYAHSVYQDSVYANCANSSDYTKRTIHEFYTSRISQGDEEFSLIEDWLEVFKIGKSLKVIPYKGDNYSLVIFDEDNPEITSDKRKGYPGGIDLADKGMGTIQVVILLLRIATLIRKYKGQYLTILLEEPEQNLHPALQSKLAEFIYDVNKKFSLKFIIETHSEYLVRHIQVLTARLNKENRGERPFKVFYLTGDEKLPCYDMGFQKNGKFEKEFGAGFFNVADDAAMELFELDDED